MNYALKNGRFALGIFVSLMLTALACYGSPEMNNRPENDWAMDRHDPQMTGHTSLKGEMLQAPEVRWRHYLGLWSNYLTVKASPGSNEAIELPEESFGQGYFGNHTLEWGLRQPSVDIDGKGAMADLPNQAAVKLAKLLPDVSGLQKVEFDNAFGMGAEENYGRMYAHDEGADKPRQIWQTERIPDMYSPVVTIADTDLDGQDEIVMMTQYHLAIYDSLTGKLKDSVRWKVGRNYGQLDVVDVTGDGRPDFVIQADAPPHLELILNEPSGARLAWSHKYLKDEADVSVPTEFFLHNLPNALTDLDGDGFHEIYGSYAYIYYALDGNTGEPIRKPLNVWHEVFNRWQSYFTPIPADFNGDGKTEFLLASYSFAIGGIAVVTPTCEIVWEKALDNSVGARGLQGVGDADGDGIPDIAFYHLDGRIACYDGKTGDMKWQVEGIQGHGSMSGGHFASGDIDSDGRDEFIFPLGSNEIIAVDHDAPDHILWRAQVSAQPDSPILADVDGDGLAEIIVCTSDGYLNVLK